MQFRCMTLLLKDDIWPMKKKLYGLKNECTFLMSFCVVALGSIQNLLRKNAHLHMLFARSESYHVLHLQSCGLLIVALITCRPKAIP